MFQIRNIRRFEFSKISEFEIRVVEVESKSYSQIRFRIRSKLIANSIGCISADWVYIKIIILYTYLSIKVWNKYISNIVESALGSKLDVSNNIIFLVHEFN